MSKKRRTYHRALLHFKTDLGNAFRQLREERGLSLEELAEALELKSTYLLDHIENGTCRRLFAIFRVCCFYGKRPLISFAELPEEENLFIQIEKNRCAKLKQ